MVPPPAEVEAPLRLGLRFGGALNALESALHESDGGVGRRQSLKTSFVRRLVASDGRVHRGV